MIMQPIEYELGSSFAGSGDIDVRDKVSFSFYVVVSLSPSLVSNDLSLRLIDKVRYSEAKDFQQEKYVIFLYDEVI